MFTLKEGVKLVSFDLISLDPSMCDNWIDYNSRGRKQKKYIDVIDLFSSVDVILLNV
jgi:hypothetical protein